MNLERSVLRVVLWPVHRALFRLSGGRVGTQEPSAKRVGTLFLTTTGRRSGAKRTVPVFFIRDGENFVVVASNAGDERDPAWYSNLTTTPEVTARARGDVGRYFARTATGDERERLWLELVKGNPGFKRYERRTDREIPVVILEPRRGGWARRPT